MHGLFLPQKIIVYINSVDFLDDIYVKKNAYYTKDQWLDDLAADRTPDHSKTLSSLHTQSVEFPKRRKVIAQAFFKSKIAGLAKTIARVTLGELAQLKNDEIVDLPVFTQNLYSKISITFLVGRKNSTKTIQWEMDDGRMKEINICHGVQKCMQYYFSERVKNPVFILFPFL